MDGPVNGKVRRLQVKQSYQKIAMILLVCGLTAYSCGSTKTVASGSPALNSSFCKEGETLSALRDVTALFPLLSQMERSAPNQMLRNDIKVIEQFIYSKKDKITISGTVLPINSTAPPSSSSAPVTISTPMTVTKAQQELAGYMTGECDNRKAGQLLSGA